ncbi:MAG: YciI family protein [Pseudonocardiaceae bacterium]
MSDDERDELTRQVEALRTEVTESGEFVGGAALADPVNTKAIRMHEGALAITDGPFIEAKEQLAGYFVVDCSSPGRATEIAAQFPDVRFGGVEVRPIMDTAGQEM